MRIAQISDTHISHEAPDRLADLERCVAQINNLTILPDVTIHTGDVSHDGLPEQFAAARDVLETLRCPWFVIPGNKDPRDAMIDAFFDGHAPGASTPFIQYSIETFDVRLILLDTYTSSSNKGALCGDRLRELADMLSKDTSKPAAIFMHHPPFHVPVGPDALQFVDANDLARFGAVVKRHSKVCGIYCGHVHRPATGLVEGVPATVMTASALDRRFGETEPTTDDTPLYRMYDIAPTL